MLAHQPNRPRTTTRDLARREALRAHIDQLSLEQQRAFVTAALQLIIARPSTADAEVAARFCPSIPHYNNVNY